MMKFNNKNRNDDSYGVNQRNFNTNNYNADDYSQGDYNQGYYNADNHNQGNSNAGNSNQGNSNAGDNHVGNSNMSYQQMQPPYYNPDREVMSVGQWILTTFLVSIPCIGFVMLLVWAFGNGNENRKNFCRAALIWSLVIILIYILVLVVMAFGVSVESVTEVAATINKLVI